MTNVIVQVTQTVQVSAPGGTIPGGWSYTLTPQTGTALNTIAATNANPVTFSNVPDGVWTASVARLDSNGVVIGTAATAPAVTISNPISVDTPQTITVTVA